MRLHFTLVPVFDGEAAAAELNAFLAQHRVLSVERELVTAGTSSAWAMCVTYVEGRTQSTSPAKRKVDYRDTLSPPDFEVFAALRRLRKELATKEAVPAYHVLTNAQLAALVQLTSPTRQGFAAIDGVGPARTDKYADLFLEALTKARASLAS